MNEFGHTNRGSFSKINKIQISNEQTEGTHLFTQQQIRINSVPK